MEILVSAGEASGDLYAAKLVEELRGILPQARFFGCAGPRMRAAGVEAIVESESLSVVGLVEVIEHLPRIYGEFRKLVRAMEQRRPRLAILTDSPDFHFRVAAQAKKRGIPVAYLVAPQVWAWRKGRVRTMKKIIDELFCIFPFEPAFFHERGMPQATYIGHPLAWMAGPSLDRAAFFRKHELDERKALLTLLPGSRIGEVGRHLPALVDAVELIRKEIDVQVAWAAPAGFLARGGDRYDRLFPGSTFRERISRASIQIMEGETWDAIAHATLALAASGTVAMEAALMGTPMVTFYKVSPVSWKLGRWLVDVPFFTMVNLVAGRRIVPELMQNEGDGPGLATAALRLLTDKAAQTAMRSELAAIQTTLRGEGDPLARTAKVLAARFFPEL
ncbi:MAG TPA: lipid-A-disaccharide synthase [Bryobacteraceae bacterium]|nr:lipid-A-disaccharide synthase [Bryobacteraceae bacterium]